MNRSNTLRAQNLEMQYNWLCELLTCSFNSSFSIGFQDLCSQVVMPELSEENKHENVLLGLIREHSLSKEEYFILLLSLSPYYIPTFFTKRLGEKNDTITIGSELLLNKSLVSDTYLPTLDTALLVLSGHNADARHRYFPLFLPGSKLFSKGLLEPQAPSRGEPFTRSVLAPSQYLLTNLLTGKKSSPEFSHDFPATLLTSDFSWDELVLDYNTRLQLQEVKEWIEYEDICRQKNLDLEKFKKGYKCLFHGPPGTGKTLAASVIGKLTGKDVYRIDLSAVVSKYIGETEKNLSIIFDRASQGNWILFFDEADALFGKRGSTNSAHDRYANQEVSYLLQRFESYEGVSILASNFRDNIDSAFFRRFHGVVRFKAPEYDERLQLWTVHLPKGFKFEEGVDLNEVSQKIKINGAGIYNVMRRSCMKAVLNGDNIVRGNDMFTSIKQESAKENKLL